MNPFNLDEWTEQNGSILCKKDYAELVKIGFEKACSVILEEVQKKALPSEVDSDGEAAGIERYWLKMDDLKSIIERVGK